ncbi:glycoside hydrolase family 97 protein [Lentimicrobium sp. L6]|uniref:glycoside hydrolase family 97 protein n=1 Tax=Lentimicrobium sp. L6 TaxID=2735916 RepID=UPI001553C954|nr:glycoside hydrolase family 97 protein [Lentimicrobium sp. L6]NPD85329.1 glycoside hydrolase family 97 protein [Lentimicrobium sp. L6]
MYKKLFLVFIVGLVSSYACHRYAKNDLSLSSPSERIKIEFSLNDLGTPFYQVVFDNKDIIKKSSMGFDLLDAPALDKGFEIIGSEEMMMNENWEMPWGEQRMVNNHFEELKVMLQEKTAPKRLMNIYFRAYDDGVAFRYEFPEQNGVEELMIVDEKTEFQLTGDHKTWWIPGDWDIYEHLYNTTKVSEIDALEKAKHVNLAQTSIPYNAVNTPVTMRTEDGIHLSFHEANLTDYAGMTLKVDTGSLVLTSGLVGSKNHKYKVKRSLPFVTPWRTIQIADEAKDLISSKLILNLNEANKLGDVSWFKPMKYVGIWWEMHLGIATWDYGMTQNMNTWEDTGKAHGKHGATTENAKRYIDFAAKNGMSGILVEGWNTGWEHWIGFEDREGVFDFVTCYPDYDIEEVVRYGRERGVELIMHHETSAAVTTYDQQMDTAFALMESLGIHSVKTGYVGKIIPKGEFHHGQWMVNHYRRVLETAAKYKVAINAHEPIKATGIRRTLPNAIAREGLRGQEFNAWANDGGNPPEHLTIVPFTRMLAGPIDFTPGVFDIKLSKKTPNPNWGAELKNQINTTLAHQLALYVVLYSPIQMACDLPEHYEGNPALQFIRDVGVDWEQSIVLDGEVGEFVIIARQERETMNWFVGAVSDENPRDITIDFSFLEEGKNYKVIVYKDGEEAHWNDNPLSLVIEEVSVNKNSKETFHLAAGGGLAISLILD